MIRASAGLGLCALAFLGLTPIYRKGIYAQTANSELIDFTLIKFDSRRIEKVCVAIPVGDVAELDAKSYQPGAATPLIDAAYKTIKAVEKSLNGKSPKVIVCIQTDGHENASTEHSWEELNALIKEKSAAGWQFNFLGTGIDAYDTGAKMGVAAMHTMSTGRSAKHVRASYVAAAESALNYVRGRASSTEFSLAARASSGDQFYDKAGLGTKPRHQWSPLCHLPLRILVTRPWTSLRSNV
jgi:hypothetical protein